MKTLPAGLTVGYVTSGEWTSRLIEWRSAGGPSHATTLVAPGWVIDARLQGGVQRRPISYLADAQVRWLRVPATDAQVVATIKALESQVGQRYDWLDIVGFAVPAAFPKNLGDKRPWICSALQAWAEERGGILTGISTEPGRIDPNDIMLMNEAARAIEIPGPLFA